MKVQEERDGLKDTLQTVESKLNELQGKNNVRNPSNQPQFVCPHTCMYLWFSCMCVYNYVLWNSTGAAGQLLEGER